MFNESVIVGAFAVLRNPWHGEHSFGQPYQLIRLTRFGMSRTRGCEWWLSLAIDSS